MKSNHVPFVRLYVGVLTLLGCTLHLYATDAPAPTEEEETIFEAKKARLIKHQPHWPQSVQDALDSLDNPVEITFTCENTTIQSVQIRVTTSLCGWSSDYVKKNGGKDGTIGHYTWKYDEVQQADGVKTIEFENCIMLDPAVAGPHEQDAFGRIIDETLLYHELLHGQLQINAMRDNAEWQQSLCECNDPDLSHADWAHATIHDLELAYAQALGQLEFGPDAVIEILNPSPEIEAVDEEGNFRLPVPLPEDKDELIILWYTPTEANVENLALEFDDEGNAFLTGKLTDPSKPGYVQVHVDPPLHFIATGIEDSAVIHPSSGPMIPATSTWGVLALVVLIAIGATIVLRRREEVAHSAR